MILNLIFFLHALSSIPFAALLLFEPDILAQLLTGATISEEGKIFARLYGGCLVLVAHTAFRAQLAFSFYARELALWVLLVQQLLGLLISLTFVAFPAAFWLSFLLFLVFAIGYLYILLLRPSDI